jgi:hypothetical protein
VGPLATVWRTLESHRRVAWQDSGVLVREPFGGSGTADGGGALSGIYEGAHGG